ncbi:helix-turn-helix domain-containing protein [Paludibaculum fermentans]|uniref:Helix-turn-helix transcriptional regulator n=1 Tax=Paludibaculum fermentans TaxID=1473598 RepID=A0A7S7NT39_PALFE|nr:AraC family transcriptional regulator [Paludibaculum fermentans]QOY89233.1 helix-turn-helix transcriptional regulator [Paludibaculum fermentans]
MVRYREHAPPAHLAGSVECFWTYDADSANSPQRVLPDACEDIVFMPDSGLLAAVGTMTRAQVYAHTQPQTLVGVRFHPSMARQFLGIAANELTDSLVDLSGLWGGRGEQLRSRMSSAATGEEAVSLLAGELRPGEETPAQKMVLWVVEQAGRVRLDDLARFAGLSQRHLRRVFLEQTGVSPKLFCRVVRFRSLVSRLSQGVEANWADLALDYGYYDQSHLVNEFRELSGVTPTSYVARP